VCALQGGGSGGGADSPVMAAIKAQLEAKHGEQSDSSQRGLCEGGGRGGRSVGGWQRQRLPSSRGTGRGAGAAIDTHQASTEGLVLATVCVLRAGGCGEHRPRTASLVRQPADGRNHGAAGGCCKAAPSCSLPAPSLFLLLPPPPPLPPWGPLRGDFHQMRVSAVCGHLTCRSLAAGDEGQRLLIGQPLCGRDRY
jgi:hypothetical protein